MEAPSSSMSSTIFVLLFLFASSLLLAARGEDPYRFYTWNITFGDIYPLGVKQEVCVHQPVPTHPMYIPLFFFFSLFSALACPELNLRVGMDNGGGCRGS